MAEESTSRRYRGTPSEHGVPFDEVERVAERAAKEAEHALLLRQLMATVETVIIKVDNVQKDMGELKLSVRDVDFSLKNGTTRMDRMDGHIEGLKKRIHEGETNRLTEEREKRGLWSKVVPNLVTSIVSTILTAAILGGLTYSILSASDKENSRESNRNYPVSAPLDRNGAGSR